MTLKISPLPLIPRPPIQISGDLGFLDLAQSGVIGGNGTQSNPYVIRGWDIDVLQWAQIAPSLYSAASPAVVLSGTSKYCILEFIKLLPGNRGNGIYISQSKNVMVRYADCKIKPKSFFSPFWGNFNCDDNTTGFAGINVENSTNVTVSSNQFSCFDFGVYNTMSTGTTVDSNTIDQCGTGIYSLDSSVGLAVTNNKITNSIASGIYMSIGPSANGISDAGGQIISGNTIKNNGLKGWLSGCPFTVDGCGGITIRQANNYGLTPASIHNNLLDSNGFYNIQGVGLRDATFRNNIITNGSSGQISAISFPPGSLSGVTSDLDLQQNYWGSASGPNQSDLVTQDGSTINYSNWLVSCGSGCGP